MKGNQNKKQSGEFISWMAKGLTAHAGKQVETYEELRAKGINLETRAATEMRNCVMAIARGKGDEWEQGLLTELAGQAESLKRLSQLIVAPSQAANAISSVTEDGQVKVKKWRIIGDPKAVYCVKHSSKKSPATRGHTYVDSDGNELGLHCQKCISELSNKKGVHQLRRLLERSGKLKRSGGRKEDERKGEKKPTLSMEERARALLGETQVLQSGIPETQTSLTIPNEQVTATLMGMSMVDLRAKAKAMGFDKLPRSKLGLALLIQSK